MDFDKITGGNGHVTMTFKGEFVRVILRTKDGWRVAGLVGENKEKGVMGKLPKLRKPEVTFQEPKYVDVDPIA